MATYVNNLRLKEITTGDEDGTWGVSTNTNLELITDGFSYGTKEMAADANETFTMPDGTADDTRSFYLKITSAVSLTATREVTLGPNTISKVWMIENATSGSQIITIKQGSGATVNVPNGSKVMVVTDGAGAGAAVFNANPTEAVVDLTSDVTGTLPLANGGTGASLTDPDADRIFFWDDSVGSTAFLTVGSGLAISGTTLSSTDAGGTVTSVNVSGGTTGLTTSGGPITGSGTITLAGTLAVANGGTGVTSSTGTGSVVLSSAPTITSLALDGAYSEEVYALTGTALDPANGTLQTKTLAANTTFTESLTSGESMVLMLGAGASYTVTWPTITWVTSAGNVAPTLTANDTIVLWKISSTLYGAYAGSYA